MSHNNVALEKGAIHILQRGVDLDTKRRYTEALVCYQEGLQLLVDYMKGVTDAEKKKYLRNKVEEYIGRAEKLKNTIELQKKEGNFHEQINIENNSTGHSYKSVFGRFLGSDVIDVVVEDPYIRTFHQCQNLLRLCELLVKSCSELKRINLLTSSDANHEQQKQWLSQLKHGLAHRFNVQLEMTFSSTLHDRQIKLSNGWIIKIGRGLDYFKPPEGKLALGMFDFDLRLCHETVVDIFHSADVHKSYG